MMKSLYVHIPFCDHICTYCDFCKVFYNKGWADQYLDALSFEIEDKEIIGDYDTVYIGGGTPSSLSYQQLERLLKLLQTFVVNVKEYTIEVNPESLDEEKLDLIIKYGVNRLSIGVQSFQDDLLKTINRHHSSMQALILINKAKEKGINDINIDLIYGLPNQSLDDVERDILIINDLNISHISVYSLILEEHTILGNQHYKPLSDEDDADWYHRINDMLEENGFLHYEVSNYYKDKPSLHNLMYWQYQDYQGIGLSAHSLVRGHRIENTKSLTQYFNHQYLENDCELSMKDQLFEKIMMGLRLTKGISIKEINDMYHIDFEKLYKNVTDKYIQMNMLEKKDGYLRTTSLGMDYLNTILIGFMDDK